MYKNIFVIGSEVHSTGLDMTSRGRGVSVILEMEQERLY
jgi:3-oxoacyl-[acyl-carrier-protein] synthase-3